MQDAMDKWNDTFDTDKSNPKFFAELRELYIKKDLIKAENK